MSLASSLAFLVAAAAKFRPAANADVEETRRLASLERELATAKREVEAIRDQRDTLVDEVARWQVVARNWEERCRDEVASYAAEARRWQRRFETVMDDAARIIAASPPPVVRDDPRAGGGGGGGGRIHTIQTPPRNDGFWQDLGRGAPERTAEQEAQLGMAQIAHRDAMLRAAVFGDFDGLERVCNCVPSRAQVWTSGDR
jgi:hypothetical protein